MPTASIDFTLASFAMIVLVMGAIFGVNIVVSPYIEDDSHDPDRYQQIGKFMLLSQGEPSNWGEGGTPMNLGFAGGGDPYDLDIDKVTRLNALSAQALNYSSAWQALGIDDVSFKVIFLPAARFSDVEQARAGLPSNSIKQAPQAACPEQPSLTDVIPFSSRRKLKSDVFSSPENSVS